MAQYSLKSYSVPPLSGVWENVRASQTVYTDYQDLVIPKPTVNFHAVWDGKISSMALTRRTGATLAPLVPYILFGDASNVVRWSVPSGQIVCSDHWRGSSAAAIGNRGRGPEWTIGDIAKVRLRFGFAIYDVGDGFDVGITVAASQVHIYSEC